MVALKLSVLIFALIVLVTSIINIIFYSKASQGLCSTVSVGFATFMMWVNIIFVVLIVGLFIWTMIRLFRKKPQQVKVAPGTCPPPSTGPKQPPVQSPVGGQSQAYRRTTTIEEPVSTVRTPQEELDREKISEALSRHMAFD